MSDINKNIDASATGGSMLTNVEYECRNLSKAFYITGNETMGECLQMMAADIREANELMRGALAGEINDRCREAQKGVGDLLGMMLDSSNKQMRKVLDEG